MKKPPFLENQIYHLYNRGVEKRDVYLDTQDYSRFIHYLFEFNNTESNEHLSRKLSTPQLIEIKPQLTESQLIMTTRKPRKLLVEILVFCLMPNHYHIMLRQKVDGGIVKFMQKLGTGFTMYFNQKYNRVGSLFQGRFKAVLLEKDAHFLYLPHYIHLNPLDLLNGRGSTSTIERRRFLEEYRWSSFPDYIGKKNFPSVTQRNFLLETFGDVEGYRKDIAPWFMDDVNGFNKIKDVLFDEGEQKS